jgi:hypothetical protein
MPAISHQYSDEVQYVGNNTPIDDILYLLKRDGAVFIRNLVSYEDVDTAYKDVKERLEDDLEWEGNFFPSKSSQHGRRQGRSAVIDELYQRKRDERRR